MSREKYSILLESQEGGILKIRKLQIVKLL